MNYSIQNLLKYKIAGLLIAAIAIALFMTFISIGLYVRSGVASLDLSRPGYEQARKQVAPSTSTNFEMTGPINKKALDEFRKLYQQEQQQLQGSSDFSDQTLQDSQLRFTPETQNTPGNE